MKQFFLFLGSTLAILSGYAQCTDLFFSEYLEGASNNKALEIYNPTPDTIDLSGYKIYRYNNGATTKSDSLALTGMLLPGDVYVAANSSSVATILAVADTTHTITFFNGDDVLELVNKVTNTTLDIIGIIGVDPGTNWAVGSGATSENTLVRMSNIHQGTTNWTQSVTEWVVYPQNTDTKLGAHTMKACCFSTPPAFLNLTSTETNCLSGFASLTFSVQSGVAPYTFALDTLNLDTLFAGPVQTDTVWASTVLGFSTQYGNPNWAAHQVLGVPNTYPIYGDISTAWTSSSSNGGREFLVIGFPTTVATNVLVYETYNPGFTDTVYVREAATGNWVMIYSDTAVAGPQVSVIQDYPIPSTVGAVDAVRIAMDCAAVSGWNEVDAIGLVAPNTVSLDSLVAGTYTLTVSNSDGCSTDTLLTVSDPAPIVYTQALTICSNQEVIVGENSYNTTGMYTDVLVSVNGCDSTVITNLTVNAGLATYFDQTLTLCAGSSFIVGTNTYTTSGMYLDTLVNAAGCDSVVISDLTFYSTNTPQVTVTELVRANVAFGGTASASDEYNGNPAEDAFDGDILTTGWANAGDSLPSWLEYDFGSGNAKVLTGYAFYCSEDMVGGWDWAGYCPGAWYFQGFNGTSWDTLDAQSFSPVQNTWYTFNIANTTAYEKYRMYIYGSYDGDYAMVTELELLTTPTCADKVFEATINDVAEPATFQWSRNGSPLQGETSQKLFLPNFTIGDVVSCAIVTTNSCALDTTASSQVTITQGPSSTTNNVTLCFGGSLTVGNNTYTASGTYTDFLVSSVGCDSVIVTNLTISPAVNVTTTVTGETITANATGATFQWIDCQTNSPISGATAASFTPTVKGNYAVVVTVGNCSDTSACDFINVGIDKSLSRRSEVVVFPNPSNGTFSVKARSAGTFTLVNTLGQTVETIELNAANHYQATISGIQAAGVYFLTGDGGMLYSKVVINP